MTGKFIAGWNYSGGQKLPGTGSNATGFIVGNEIDSFQMQTHDQGGGCGYVPDFPGNINPASKPFSKLPAIS